MTSELRGTVTKLLQDAADGDDVAWQELFEAVYTELHAQAGYRMRGERPDHTLQPTALVNEAYLRLVEGGALKQGKGRAYFFAAAAKAMERILIEYHRKRTARKRGGGRARVAFDDVLDSLEAQRVDIIVLQDLLEQLEELNPRQSTMIRSQVFFGSTVQEIADTLDVSVSTVEKDLRLARAWLRQQLSADSTEDDS